MDKAIQLDFQLKGNLFQIVVRNSKKHDKDAEIIKSIRSAGFHVVKRRSRSYVIASENSFLLRQLLRRLSIAYGLCHFHAQPIGYLNLKQKKGD